MQLAFCSVGSNKSCLPGSPPRQEQLPREPTGPPTSQASDSDAVCRLCRDLITPHMAKHCSGHKMTSSPLFIRRNGYSTLPQLYYTPLWWKHILDGQKSRCLEAGLLIKHKPSIQGTQAGAKRSNTAIYRYIVALHLQFKNNTLKINIFIFTFYLLCTFHFSLYTFNV